MRAGFRTGGLAPFLLGRDKMVAAAVDPEVPPRPGNFHSFVVCRRRVSNYFTEPNLTVELTGHFGDANKSANVPRFIFLCVALTR